MADLIPEHIRDQFGGTTRAFKQTKRAELDAALAALREFQRGCAFIPLDAYREFDRAHGALKAVRDQINLENWGR